MNKEAKAVEAELMILAPLFSGNLAFSEISDRVASALRESQEKIAAELAAGRQPVELCVKAICKASAVEVAYGGHYLYRGILTLYGAQMFGVWKAAMSELVRLGHVNPETFSERRRELEAFIAETG